MIATKQGRNNNTNRAFVVIKEGENMGFLKWLLSTLVIDPLVMLFLWNVIISVMFNCGKTTFSVCFVISIILNIFVGTYKLGNDR